ncbi:7,8-didemethyl-8-hydroxy-5-deazariboflavin synthase subunit 1 [Natrialba magadii ATCC 43099]|uniref:7,8-didemethyl-8-hydroxy-5-deazariboflavin synthase n=1 Tax=Natrialba magadii (strain ATCC 43099 / DSM 3394 / CCM 3739 / CIP 104546 / IAM 13178 / JCM 8861 / NBRC 102185 / NCIMB 2190 / MS3) TaxID=547559 RepID=D3SZ00_NATMM|nr:7,8-didemethyl-8-hydroxy-5-deazariboflavin synthase subunit CofG [Natrialba magadii]ADD06192.1 7,8-didemethyl-8-hydroxy-5-deazariboflavin synthase subunit 1 [Natrialba magadii ATCC 43099]ELY30809.1 FO synthase subunit 1 [Natrialba magadii ATCC 43099]
MIPGASEYGVELSIDEHAVEDLLSVEPDDVDSPSELTFARNVFVPLTTACRYTCTYCTYFDAPGQASLLSLEAVRDICERGADAGCTEALFTFGDDPDDRYTEIHDQLAEWGYDSIHDYLRAACEVALETGLLPHANPGDQTREQMATVADVNASMGVMLETTAEVDAHAGPRRKEPGQRLRTLQNAGELDVAFTTGILVGIGEDWRDRAESLLAIRDLHERYDHIQEVIVQPVTNNERWTDGSPDLETMRRVTAMARAALPEEVSVQVPPNLTAAGDLVDCGVDDLGGVSPVTDDHINPDYSWPALRELESIASDAGLPLRERLPVYQRFLDDELRTETFGGTPAEDGEWISPRIRAALTADDAAGERYRAVLDGTATIDTKETNVSP